MEESQMKISTETDLRSQIKKSARTCSNWLLVFVGVICAIAIFLMVHFTTDLRYNLLSKPLPTLSVTRQEVVGPNNITLDLIQQKDAGWNDVMQAFTQQEDADRDDGSQEVSQSENACPNNNTPDVTQQEISGHNKVCLEVTQQEISGCNKVCLEVTQQVISGRNKICLEVTQPEGAGENKVSQVATRQDIFGNYSGPGVFVFLMSNEIDEPLCYSAGSALLSGLPVVVPGYEIPFNGFLSKFDYMERAIENAGLKSEDVILVTDSDTLFMGTDIYSRLPKFQSYSAKRPAELDALDVRQRAGVAPFLVSSEVSCNASDLFDSTENCALGYEVAYKKTREYANAHPEHKLDRRYDDYPNCHLNPGVVIARVWAYKEFLQKARNLTSTQKPSVNPSKGWNDEQSVYTALYLDLIKWEVEHDVFSMTLHERQAARSVYGLRAGFIGMDVGTSLSVTSSPTQQLKFKMDDMGWQRYLPSDKSELPHTQSITDIWNVSQFVSRLYKRAHDAHGEEFFEKQPMSVQAKMGGINMTENIIYVPSTFMANIERTDPQRMIWGYFPSIFYSTDRIEGFTKGEFMKVLSIGARWFVPMIYNKKAKDTVVQYLKSTPLFLSTNNSIIQDSYHARCGFPYERVIKEVNDNTRS